MSNPVIDPTGPEFLAVFAILIAATALVCWWRTWQRDLSAMLPPFTAKADPCEIAFLRAGDNELARVLIVSLIERKYLRTTSLSAAEQRIERDPGHPDTRKLTAIERAAFEWFHVPRTPEEILHLPSSLAAETLRYEQRLHSESLLLPDDIRREARKDALIGIILIVAIGVTRLVIGISRDHPVGFLVVLGIIGVVTVAVGGRPGRLSRRGQDYLERNRQEHAWLRSVTHGDPDKNPALAAALFGVVALLGTELGTVPQALLFKADGSGGGGCGGGGCSGGGGCGGGCGGCGG